jgi:hypothetical protein
LKVPVQVSLLFPYRKKPACTPEAEDAPPSGTGAAAADEEKLRDTPLWFVVTAHEPGLGWKPMIEAVPLPARTKAVETGTANELSPMTLSSLYDFMIS